MATHLLPRSAPPWAVLLAAAGCSAPYPQRLPGPLFAPEVAPPQPEAPGTAHATLQRDSDPVWIRRAGERGYVAVPYYAKRQRIPAGTEVRTGAGGRAEVLWGSDATSLVLFDDGRARVGDPESDEPVLDLQVLTRALLVLTPEDVIQLPGGARLTPDPGEPASPFFLEQVGQVLRLTNQSKRLAALAYRSERLELGPGESVDLPRLAAGTAPRTLPAERLQGAAGLSIQFEGELEREEGPQGLLLRARTPCDLASLGVRVRLAAGDSARFSLLSVRSAGVPADASVPPGAPAAAPDAPR